MELEEREYLHTQIQVFQQKLFNLVRDNGLLEAQNTILQRHAHTAQQETEQLRQQLDALRTRIQQQLDALKTRVGEGDPQIANLESELESLDSVGDPELEEALGCGCGDEAKSEPVAVE